MPNNPKTLLKKIRINVKPNLSLGITWQGPNLSWLVKAYADKKIVETKDRMKKLSKSIASLLRSPKRGLLMTYIMTKNCGIDSTRGSENDT